MTDQDNTNDPLSEDPGYASPTPPPPVPPTPTPAPPTAPTPPPVSQPPTSESVPYAPPPGGQAQYQQPYPQQYPQGYPQAAPPKKSKLWLWVTLAIVIPVTLCGIGALIFGVFVANEVTKPVDATNEFYKAVKEGQNLDDLTCQRYLDEDGDLNVDMDDIADIRGDVESYDFNSVETDESASDNAAEVTGTVTRDGTVYDTTVILDKEGDDYKVCSLRERP
jgi:hypothetical protein